MNPLECCKDHSGKWSQARISAVMATSAGIALALAPQWGGEQTDLQFILALVLGPGGLALWQKLKGAKGEAPQHEDH